MWTITKGGTITSKTTSGGLNAKAVFIRWQESDFQTPAMTTTDSTATSTGRSGIGPSATGTTAAMDQKSDSSQEGSSRAWIAGPVIGAVVASALIVFAVMWYNRRRQRQKNPNVPDSTLAPGYEIAELDEGPRVFEAPSGKIYPGPFELPSTNHK